MDLKQFINGLKDLATWNAESRAEVTAMLSEFYDIYEEEEGGAKRKVSMKKIEGLYNKYNDYITNPNLSDLLSFVNDLENEVCSSRIFLFYHFKIA